MCLEVPVEVSRRGKSAFLSVLWVISVKTCWVSRRDYKEVE